MLRTSSRLVSASLLTLVSMATVAAAQTPLPGLRMDALVVRDSNHVPHVCARSERDAMFVQGFLHAQDRFFQMDVLRRTFSGTLAELVGQPALPQDVQLRTLGLRRAAEATWAAYLANSETSQLVTDLEAYSEGVNAFLASAPALPEYGALEVSAGGIAPWTPLDSVTIGKGLAFGLSFDLDDIDRTIQLGTYQATGAVVGFDGQALFSEDVSRSAPFDPTVSIPSAAKSPSHVTGTAPHISSRTVDLARAYRRAAAHLPVIGPAFERSEHWNGSNWWIFSGETTESGHAMLANDPHLALDTPATFYEVHLLVSSTADCGLDLESESVVALPGVARGTPGAREAGSTASAEALNAIGVSFAGVPGVVLGCNERVCWGATVNPMDVTDVYQEVLQVDPTTGLPTHTLFDGQPEPLVLLPQSYRVNEIGDGQLDNSVVLADDITLVVPRRNHGPIVAVDASSQPVTGLSVQYTGWQATFELEAFRRLLRAGNVDEFASALQFFDVGSQNFAYADVDGNIAYFTSAEMPIREDLQLLGGPDGGVPPYFIRDGSHTLRHEWLPVTNPQPHQTLAFEILPFSEMPQVVNPAAGYIINANNDPIGTTLDNNPLNQLRGGGGLYYLSPGYTSLRVGRIQRLVDGVLAGGGTASQADLEAIQANNQLLDAELISPFLLAAFDHAGQPSASPELAVFAADPEIAEAIQRLANWDFSTPTGIAEGYDPGDDPAALPVPSAEEVAHSVAATLFSTWRGQAVRNVVDSTLTAVGLGDVLPPSTLAYTGLAHLLANFESQQGFGASGLDFFPVAGVAREEARDIALLQSLRDALDLLAGPEFDAAFQGSTRQDDYRWGYLHRIVFDHVLGDPFSVPPQGGFASPGPSLNGIARSGGYQAVDASSHSARADGANDFMFGSGPARRFVGTLRPSGVEAQEVIPGGQSGVLGSPHFSSQLPLWLTNAYHPLYLAPSDVATDIALTESYSAGTCVPGPQTLCLRGSRFRVEVDWNSGERQGDAVVVPTLVNSTSGLLYFFQPDNWEMLIKVLDGCGYNDHFWVFAAATTNVEYTLTVTDTVTSETAQYHNPLGQSSPAVTDTTAFATCP